MWLSSPGVAVDVGLMGAHVDLPYPVSVVVAARSLPRSGVSQKCQSGFRLLHLASSTKLRSRRCACSRFFMSHAKFVLPTSATLIGNPLTS